MNSGGRKEQKIQKSLKELFIKLDNHEKFIFNILIELKFIVFYYRCDAECIYNSVGYAANEINIQKDMMDFNRTIMSGLRNELEVSIIIIESFNFFLFIEKQGTGNY
jgi:hypothetical protein